MWYAVLHATQASVDKADLNLLRMREIRLSRHLLLSSEKDVVIILIFSCWLRCCYYF
jgi:hypothetical protein